MTHDFLRRQIPGYLGALALGAFVLTSSAQEKLDLNKLEKFSGVYELPSKRLIYIQPWPGPEARLVYTDETALTFTAENVLTAGPALFLPTPVEVRITFSRNSRNDVASLSRHRNGFPDETAKKVESYRQEDVNFQNGAVLLAGTLFLPPGKGFHPALVLIGGSGAADRYSVLPIVHFLVTHGITLLAYDKRGIGGSSGDWRTASLEELAGDAVAAVKFLQTRKDIDTNRVGVFGVSQGGWVAPLAASKSSGITFLISLSGPGMSPEEVELKRLEHDLHANGFAQDAVADALALVKLGDKVAQGRETWEHYQAAIGKAGKTQWFHHVTVPASPDSWLFEHWRRLPMEYDPGPAITKLHVPVMALFGGLDNTVQPAENAEIWRVDLLKGKVKDYTIKVFPNGNHMLLEARTGAEEEFPTLKRFVPEYAPFLLDWLRERRIVTQ